MTLASGARSNVLESLIIELIGDDSNLQAIFDSAVTDAKAAAARVSKAFSDGFSGVDTQVAATVSAIREQNRAIDATGAILDNMMRQAQTAFEIVAEEGAMSAKAFERYRKEALLAVDVIEGTARAAGASGQSFDDLRRKIKETTYEQDKSAATAKKQRTEQSALDQTITNLAARIATQRNLWASRVTSDEEFTTSTRKLRAEMMQLAESVGVTDVQMRKITQSAAYAQRGIDSASKVASRGGLAWTAQIALSNQFGQSLRNLGPAGGAAAGALGLVGGAVTSLFQPMSAADMSFRGIAETISRFAFVIAPMAAAVGALAGAAGLGALTISAARTAADLDRAAQSAGFAVEAYQEVAYALQQTGVTFDQTRQGLNDFNARLGQAATGSTTIAKAYSDMGVAIRDANGQMRGGEEVFLELVEALSLIPSAAGQAAKGGLVFGEEFSRRVIPLLNEGVDGFRLLREEARALGLVISGDTVMSLSEFQAEIDTVRKQFEVLRVEVGAAFLPLVRDVLMPLIRDQLIPWLQTVTKAVDNFADSFFDTSDAGAAFRADQVRNLQAVILLGQGVVAAAGVVAGAVQAILGVGSGLVGAGSGLAEWNAQNEEIVEARQALIDRVSEQQRQLAAIQANDWPQGFPEELKARAEEAVRGGLDAATKALEEFDARYPQGAFGSIAKGFERGSENLLGGALDSFTFALETLGTDMGAKIEEWAAGLSERAARAPRSLGDAFGGVLGDGSEGVKKAIEGSIAYADEQIKKFGEQFRNAIDDEARATARAGEEHWREVLEAMLKPFEEEDVLAAARLWTERLSAELRAGAKEPTAVFDLLVDGIERTKRRLERERIEFGFDSDTYRNTLAQLSFLEQWLSSFRSQYATEPLTIEFDTVIKPPTETLSFALPMQDKSPAQALVEFYTGLLRVADAQAELNGITEQTRGEYQETIDILEAILPGLDRMSSDWLLVANALIQARRGLAEVNEELAVPPSTVLRDFLSSIVNAASAARSAIESLYESVADSSPVRAIQGAIATAQALERDALTARFTGGDFDATASEIKALTTEVNGLIERYDTLGFLERVRLSIASQRLIALNAEAEAEKDATEAAKESEKALNAWLSTVSRLGSADDALTNLAVQLQAFLDAGTITAQQYDVMLRSLADAQDRLLGSTLDSGAFDSWAQSIGRVGVVLDPVTLSAAELGRLMDEGRITAEQYAMGMEFVADALDRLAAIDAAKALEEANKEAARALEEAAKEAARELDELTREWTTAAGEINDAFGRVDSTFDKLRATAQEAFDAGIISAEDLARALRLINAMEVAHGFRSVAAELTGIASLLPTLAADLTLAFGQFTDGQRTAAITSALSAVTATIRGLQAAFADTGNIGAAVFDVLVGGAATLATVLGGPELGQAVAAAGELIKTLIGDLTNGMAEVRRAVDETIASSRYLGEGVIQGIAESNTSRVSRGGFLGLLGLTKAELDAEGFRAGLALAEGIADGLVGTLRAGDFDEAWKSMIDDVIIGGIIERFLATPAIQAAIAEVFALLDSGDTGGGAERLDQLKEDFREVWEIIQGVIGTVEEFAVDIRSTLASGIASALDSPTIEEAWQKTTLAMKNVLRDAIIQAFIEGEAMTAILDNFNAALNDALSDGVISPKELARLEAIFADAEGPLGQLFDALEALGLGFLDLNDMLTDVTNSMSNVPSVFKDVSATFDATARDPRAVTTSLLDPQPRVPLTVTFTGPVYGMDDFERRVAQAFQEHTNVTRLQSTGVTRGSY